MAERMVKTIVFDRGRFHALRNSGRTFCGRSVDRNSPYFSVDYISEINCITCRKASGLSRLRRGMAVDVSASGYLVGVA
ncbi:MAG: hypothetical protein AAB787_02285 [Patescibacteria group bacterium]